uniref:Myozenin 3a n=1 Tax=Oryzias sinensis TaxID=183150 RepID=A0A8C7WUJ8_9TELE
MSVHSVLLIYHPSKVFCPPPVPHKKYSASTTDICSIEGLNLGKKISVPKDVMMEELNLPSNRGSRMFQERQRRVDKFTLENVTSGPHYTNVRPESSQKH